MRGLVGSCLVVAILPFAIAAAQPLGRCGRPQPRAQCVEYTDLEFQAGTRWGAGFVAMRNVRDSIAYGVAGLAVIHERSPGGVTLELRRRRWLTQNRAVDLAAGPVWTLDAKKSPTRPLPNGATAGVNLMVNGHVGVFGRLSHMRYRGEPPETRVGIGAQMGSQVGLPVLLVAGALALGVLYLGSGGT